jgi:hypothetical protein
MSSLDEKTIDQVSLKLSGLIGVFEMMVLSLSGNKGADGEKNTMLDFSCFISSELQGLFKTVSGVDYNS